VTEILIAAWIVAAVLIAADVARIYRRSVAAIEADEAVAAIEADRAADRRLIDALRRDRP